MGVISLGQTVSTNFSITQKAYVLEAARDSGVLAHGTVSEIKITIGRDGTTIPQVYYKMVQNLLFTPPGGYFAEYQLGTKEQAEALARQYHQAMKRFHEDQADAL